MDLRQEAQFLAQMTFATQLGAFSSTNTRDLSKAWGIEPPENVQVINFQNQASSISFWKKAPDVPHHKYMECHVGEFDKHQIPMALLAQERDNFVQKKMQSFLRNMRNKKKSDKYTDEENEKFEYLQHTLLLSSRQRYIRDNFYNSFQIFASGKILKPNDLKQIFRLPTLTQMERKKGYVIRGISYNDFLWPKGKDFTPATPFSVLPRHIIRNREKEKSEIDLNASVPVVLSILSESASIIVAQQSFKFFNEMRNKFHSKRLVKHHLENLMMSKEAQRENEEILIDKETIEDDLEFFHKYWPAPTFNHPLRIVAQPSILQNVELHSHQIKGLSWLIHMYDNHMNALLADEVGLGKTLQIISFFAYLKEARHINGPHLVVVPNAVMVTWRTEFEKYLPSAKFVFYHSKAKSRHNFFNEVVARTDFDILLTTYSILFQDQDKLGQITWRTAVFDEGHKLKNPKAQIFKAVEDTIFSDFRIIVTATPYQNKLEELWAILSLIRPSYFGNLDKFKLFFSRIEKKVVDPANHELVVHRLHEVIRPFTLRRSQDEVAVEIPGKYEVTLKVSPSELQNSIMAKGKKEGLDNNKQMYITKRLSNSPILFFPRDVFEKIDPEYLFSRTPKLQLLDVILQKLITTGHRFLIYSQWTSMMDLLEIYLNWRKIETSRIDGSVTTSERSRLIKSFVVPGSPVKGMLLSTRSSAFGLNLQAADTVILFDSDYNPFIELQASARVHRMGQTNSVVIVRLMTNDTGEEHILRIARRKFKMGQQIITAGMFNLGLPEENKINIEGEKTVEIVNPTEQQLNEILARGKQEEGILAFQPYLPPTLPDENNENYQKLDNEAVDAYIDIAVNGVTHPNPDAADPYYDEFEDVD